MIALLIAQLAPVVLPFQWLEYCGRTQDPGCAIGRELTATELAYINKSIVQGFTLAPDPEPDGDWQVFPADRRADCDDHVVSVRAALRALGVPPERMRIEIGYAGETMHLVLWVELADGGWVLDVLTPTIAYPDDRRPPGWRPLARQEAGEVIWPQGD